MSAPAGDAAPVAATGRFVSVAEEREFTQSGIPVIPSEPVPRCDLCGGTTHAPFASGRDYESRTCRNEWTFVRCAACGHVWLHPRPAVSTLPVIYPSDYYAYQYESTIPWVARKGKELLDRRKLGGILRAITRPVEGFVDIGCGTGRYLHAMAARRVPRDRIHGLELDADVVRALNAEGFRAHHARVEDCTDIAPGSIDLATMFHVIEHVDAPSRVISRIAEWMAPGGVLAIETPNLDALDARRFRDRWWGGYHFPRHWHLYTPETLQRALREHGFEPFAVRYQTGHSFWMYSYHHEVRYGGEGRPRLARWFNPLHSTVPLAAFTAFDLLRGMLGARTSAMLVLARRVGR